jgi:hypothetical protein
MSIKETDILQACAVTNNPRVFCLPTNERPSRILSQQRRSLNLVHSLYQCGILGDQGLAVVGAGFGGLTAASYAAIHGTRVSIFEKEKPLVRFERSCRFLHPRLYDWPNDGWDNPYAQLPVLNWKANEASEVVRHILKQFDFVKDHFNVTLENNASIKQSDLHGTSSCVYVNHKGVGQKFDAVIVAVGFGEEQNRPDTLRYLPQRQDFPQYWDLERAVQLPDAKKDEIYVVGSGDGALADLIGFAAMTSHKLADDERLKIFKGDYVGLLSKIPERERDLIRTLEKRISPLRSAGYSPHFDEYESVVKTLKQSIGSDLKARCKKVTFASRIKGLDLNGTYPANRFLFTTAFRDVTIEYKEAFKKEDISSHVGYRRKSVFNGPFQKIKKNTWLLERPGPVDPLQLYFNGFDNNRGDNRLRAISLTERPISSSWASCNAWTELKENDHCKGKPLPRLMLASEWGDSVIQRALALKARKTNDQETAIACLTGLFRLYALLADRVIFTDANLIDGALLGSVVDRFDSQDRRSLIAYCRREELEDAAVALLTKDCSGFKIPNEDFELSSFFEKDNNKKTLRKKRVGNSKKGFEGSSWQILEQLAKAEDKYELPFNNVKILQGGSDKLQTATFSKGLHSLVPQTSLLDSMESLYVQIVVAKAKDGQKSDGIMPIKPLSKSKVFESAKSLCEESRDVFKNQIDKLKGRPSSFDEAILPSRTDVYENLKTISGNHFDVFSEKQPPWVSTVACWYNAAYNMAIAKKNGATACDVLWVNPIYSYSELKASWFELDVAKIGNLNKKEWRNACDKAKDDVISWRLGNASLFRVLKSLAESLGCGEQKSESVINKSNYSVDLKLGAFLTGKLQVAELVNPHLEEFSPQRAIVFQASSPESKNNGSSDLNSMVPISALIID